MTCEEVRGHLPDYALGTLPEVVSAGVRRHLRGCAACRREAAALDEGVALFGSAAHAVEPPPALKDRVMAVLAEEWSEAGAAGRGRRQLRRWAAVAAAVALLAGVLGWAVSAQVTAGRFHRDAASYRSFLQALGGRDVRVAELHPAPGVMLQGSAILYDSREDRSWVMVLARAPGLSGPTTVVLRGPAGSIRIPHPLEFGEEGEAWTGLVTAADLTRFDRVEVRSPSGTLLAWGIVSGT